MFYDILVGKLEEGLNWQDRVYLVTRKPHRFLMKWTENILRKGSLGIRWKREDE